MWFRYWCIMKKLKRLINEFQVHSVYGCFIIYSKVVHLKHQEYKVDNNIVNKLNNYDSNIKVCFIFGYK